MRPPPTIPMPVKQCSVCRVVKPLAEFGRNKTKLYGRSSACRICTQQQQKRAYTTEKNRRSKLKSIYGVSPDDYDQLLAEQYGGCAICGSRVGNKRTLSLHVDHDHATGVVRGLLCGRCNTALGMLDDNPTKVRRLLDYLEQHGK